MTRKLPVLLLMLPFLLCGCSSDKMESTKAYVKSVKKRPTKRIEPLPQVKQFASVSYSAASLPSPFMGDRVDEKVRVTSSLMPNQERPPEPLESYSLDSLAMVGFFENQGRMTAIVRDPDGVSHKIAIGNYVGTNFGKVVAVHESDIEVNEIIPDNMGGWRIRKATLTLGE